MDYIGYHRIGVKWVLIFGGCLLMFGFMVYLTFDDAAYHDMVTTGRKHLLDHLPRPVLQVLSVAVEAAIIAAIPIKLHAVLTRKMSFAIREDGIHTYPFLWNKHRFLAWANIHSAQRVQETLTFTGHDGNGRKVSLGFTPMGHSRDEILAAVARFRPDIAAGLE